MIDPKSQKRPKHQPVAPVLAVALVAALAVAAPAAAQARGGDGPTAAERAERQRQIEEELRAPRPIERGNSVWIDELTWMEVRDALEEGKTTAIIPTGGIEQNGPYLVTGKHNVVLRGMCEAIVKELGNALCAPVLKLVPEGGIEPKSGHMHFPGTISLRQETFRMVLDDVASSLRAHGFDEIVFIGDSGGNQRGMKEVAEELNARWDDAGAHYIPEFYDYASVERYMEDELGYVQTQDDGLHDNLYITSLMMVTDPEAVRYEQRVRAGKASINGVSIAPKEETIELGRRLMKFRAERTAAAIRTSIAAGHTGS